MRKNQKKIVIPVNDDTKSFFHNLLWLSYQKPVLKKGNYFIKNTLELGNICSDIQDFIYEYLGWCVIEEKHCKLKKHREEWEKAINEYRKLKEVQDDN